MNVLELTTYDHVQDDKKYRQLQQPSHVCTLMGLLNFVTEIYAGKQEQIPIFI